ncbi:transglycosylase family protein [Prescottella defluvii]|nr:transglycosylase family protein [Prescottella defluvii]
MAKFNVKRTIGTVAATAALVAAPLAMSAGTANAASGNWDAVAQCESSGNWAANTGNGFYGGLQFTDSTWKSYGGSGMAHQNSRAEQIRVAENVLAGQGRGAWPVCGKYL